VSDQLRLNALERDLLELCSMGGEPTTMLDEEILDPSPGRTIVEATLGGLLERGLVTTSRELPSTRTGRGIRTSGGM
jgi:hypothetical protein